jgi:hypothetical protein
VTVKATLADSKIGARFEKSADVTQEIGKTQRTITRSLGVR